MPHRILLQPRRSSTTTCRLRWRRRATETKQPLLSPWLIANLYCTSWLHHSYWTTVTRNKTKQFQECVWIGKTYPRQQPTRRLPMFLNLWLFHSTSSAGNDNRHLFPHLLVGAMPPGALEHDEALPPKTHACGLILNVYSVELCGFSKPPNIFGGPGPMWIQKGGKVILKRS